MYLCAGTFLTALLLCKASQVKQKQLGAAVFHSINPNFDAGDDDSAISAVFRGKRNVSSFLQLDMEDIDARKLATEFEKRVISLLDENKFTLLVRLLQQLIKLDDIDDETKVELVNRIKKKDLVYMDDVVLEDFLAGIFIYAVNKTDNLNRQMEVKEFREYVKTVDRQSLARVHFIPQYSASSIFHDDVIRPVHTIYKQAGKIIDVLIADIFDLDKERAIKARRNIVIPVNTSFETKFDGRIGDEVTPLVSENTIHGQWLTCVCNKGMRDSGIDAQISKSLKSNGISKASVRNTRVGKQDVYPFASIAVVIVDNIHYYLTAISEFDEKNKAYSSLARIGEALDKIVDFYDMDGQGFDLYIPLLGTGRSRVGLSAQESYELIRDRLLQKVNDIYGRVHIVVYPEQAEQVKLEVF